MVVLVASISIFSPAHTDCFWSLCWFPLSNLPLFCDFTYQPFYLALITFPVGPVPHSHTFFNNYIKIAIIDIQYVLHPTIKTTNISQNYSFTWPKAFFILPCSLNTQLWINSIFSQLGVLLPSPTLFISPAITLIQLGISPSFSTCQDLFFFLSVLLVQTQISPCWHLQVCLYLAFVSSPN